MEQNMGKKKKYNPLIYLCYILLNLIDYFVMLMSQ
jgi:hypothetical protein